MVQIRANAAEVTRNEAIITVYDENNLTEAVAYAAAENTDEIMKGAEISL